MEYTTFGDNEEIIHVYDLDKCFKAIQYRNDDNEKRIKYLEEENKKLREECYKDTELSKMKQQLDEMQKDYWRGFPISEEEENAIENWKKKHFEKVHNLKTADERMRAGGCIGGSWSFRFTPISLGTMGYIKCNICGEEFCFQEID